MTSENQSELNAAAAILAEDVAAALHRFAQALRGDAASPTPAPAPRVLAQGQDTTGLGASQARVLEILKASGDRGMTSVEVAKAAGMRSSNTPRLLKALAERGLVQGVGSRPTVWTLAQ